MRAIRPDRDGALSSARILVVMPSIPVQGMERANLQVMKMMREQGARILFVTEETWGERVRGEVDRIGCEAASAPCVFQPTLPRSPRHALQLLTAWTRAARRIDHIHRSFRPTHVHVTNLSYMLYCLPTLWRTRGTVVFRMPNPPDLELRGWRRLVSQFVWRRIVSRVCDILVSNSSYTLARLEEVGARPARAALIYNCLPERSRAEPSDAPSPTPGRLNVAYVGRISRDKGVAELFEAAARLVVERSDVDFYLIGEHEWRNPFAEALIAETQSRGLEDRIRFTGVIHDVAGLLEQCHLHLCPSISPNESFPNVVLEAKAAGLPSVVFPTAGLREAVRHEVDGYVCAEPSSAELYTGICRYLDDPPARIAAGQAARTSLERFSREAALQRWTRVFQSTRSNGAG